MIFGSYAGKTFDEMCEQQPHYFVGGIAQARPRDPLASFLSYVQEEYDIDYANSALRKKGTDHVIQRETPESFALPNSKEKAKTKVLRYSFSSIFMRWRMHYIQRTRL